MRYVCVCCIVMDELSWGIKGSAVKGQIWWFPLVYVISIRFCCTEPIQVFSGLGSEPVWCPDVRDRLRGKVNEIKAGFSHKHAHTFWILSGHASQSFKSMLAIMSPLGSHFNEICVLTRVWWYSCLLWFVFSLPPPSIDCSILFCSQHLTYLLLIGSRFKVRARSNAQKNHIRTHGYHGVWSIPSHRCYKTDQWRGPSGLKTWMKPLDTHIDLHTLAFTSLSVWRHLLGCKT